MKYQILKDFTVIVKWNKLNDYLKKDGKFVYELGQTISNTNTPEFITLNKMETGNLVEQVEYQIFAAGIFKTSKNPIPAIYELNDFDQLVREKYIKVIK